MPPHTTAPFWRPGAGRGFTSISGPWGQQSIHSYRPGGPGPGEGGRDGREPPGARGSRAGPRATLAVWRRNVGCVGIQSHHTPCSLIGFGAASLGKKVQALLHSLRCEVFSNKALKRYIDDIVTLTQDYGTEKGISTFGRVNARGCPPRRAFYTSPRSCPPAPALDQRRPTTPPT